jgi:dihydrofolate synthase/folylpolyglutamate synthase
MYQRVGAAAYRTDLHNTLEICRVLGNPETRFRSIHIAGTNGKGSVAHMLASVLQEAGYKVGLYTSPHLTDFRERIRIGGRKIPGSEVVAFVEKYSSALEHIQPSFFEYTFGMAMEYFALERVDVAVVEVGMGGRLDSTNVVRSILSVITNIGLDHTRFLGDTLEKIATEKAGIIKQGVPLVVGETQPQTESLFKRMAKEKSAPINFADQQLTARMTPAGHGESFGVRLDVERDGRPYLRQLDLSFAPGYQVKNTVTVLSALGVLQELGFSMDETAIRKGLLNVHRNTGLAGRWQVLSRKPLVICDAGHNREGVREVMTQIRQVKYKHLHMVLGTVDDKELDGMLSQLPSDATYYFCKASIPRALDEQELKMRAGRHGLNGVGYSSVKEALSEARQNAGADDLIFIGGSTFVVAEVLQEG